MPTEPKYTTLSIPIDADDQLGSGAGMLEIEPADRSFDNFSVHLIKRAAYQQEDGKVVAQIALPDGRYMARIRTPSGGRITKLIDVSDQGPAQQVSTVTTSRIAPQGSVDPFGLIQATQAQLEKLSKMTAQFVGGWDLGRIGSRGVTHGLQQIGSYDPVDFGIPMSLPATSAIAVRPATQFQVLNGNARKRVNAALRGQIGIGSNSNEWARDHLLEFLGLQEHGSKLRSEHIFGVGDIADLPVDLAAAGQEWYVFARNTEGKQDKRFLARYPVHWRAVGSGEPLAARIAATPDGDGGFSVQLGVPDESVQAILNFMQQTDLEAALSLVERSAELLYFKHDNPYAAAAAGYVLLAAPPERTPEAYYQWISNLARLFEEVPDGCVQHATLLLQTKLPPNLPDAEFPFAHEQRCALACSLLLEALCRGLPLYRSAFKLLVSNLRILENEPSLASDMRRAMTTALALVNQLRLRLDVNQPFTIIDVTDLELPPWQAR